MPTLQTIVVEPVAEMFMERPSIATDSKCQPHFVCDAGGNTKFLKFHKIGGKWSGGVFATGSKGGEYDASRLYVGQIEIDAKDRAWISCKFGVKEYGKMYGQGLWLFKKVAVKPKQMWFRFVCVYKGMGLVSLNTARPDEGIVLGTYGNWNAVDAKGVITEKSSIQAGPGGEKVRFRIASGVGPRSHEDGVWHTVMNGYSKCSSSYQNDVRWAAGLKPLVWAPYSQYPQQGSDFCHPGIGIDPADPEVCYMAAVFGKSLVFNVYDGEKMISDVGITFDPTAIFEQRHGAAFAPLQGGGTVMFWSNQHGIVFTSITSKGVTSGQGFIAPGRSPAACTDREGRIHLVYKSGDTIMYRKLVVM